MKIERQVYFNGIISDATLKTVNIYKINKCVLQYHVTARQAGYEYLTLYVLNFSEEA